MELTKAALTEAVKSRALEVGFELVAVGRADGDQLKAQLKSFGFHRLRQRRLRKLHAEAISRQRSVISI